jgi:hypothetical protein
MGWWPTFHSQQSITFLFSTASRQTVGPIQPPIQWQLRALFPVIKWQEHEGDHLSPSSAEKDGTITPLPHVFRVQCLTNQAQGLYASIRVCAHAYTLSLFHIYWTALCFHKRQQSSEFSNMMQSHILVIFRGLNIQVPDQWLIRGGPILWPLRSPDLSQMEFFFASINSITCGKRSVLHVDCDKKSVCHLLPCYICLHLKRRKILFSCIIKLQWSSNSIFLNYT